MATKTRKLAIVQHDDQEQAPEGQQAEPTAPKITEIRAALRAQGLRRCPTHAHYSDRLPEGVQTPAEGQTDPAIRPLSEFNKGTAACRNCAHLRDADKRAVRRQAASVVAEPDTAIEPDAE